MHALVQTIAFRGIDTIPVDVQVHCEWIANHRHCWFGR